MRWRQRWLRSDPDGEDAHPRGRPAPLQWLCEFWKDGTYSKAAHLGLAEMYVADDRSKAYYEAVAPALRNSPRCHQGVLRIRTCAPPPFAGGRALSSLVKHASAPQRACFTSEDA